MVVDGQETKSHQREERSTGTAIKDGTNGSKDVRQETPATPEGTSPCHATAYPKLTTNSDRDDQRRLTDKFLLPYSLESRSCFRKPLYYQHVTLPTTLMLKRDPQLGRPDHRLDAS